MRRIFLVLFVLSGALSSVKAQRIVYSQTDREDEKNLNFEIIGKVGERYLIYKNYRNDHSVSVFDNDMKLVERVDLDFLPDKLLATDILAYRDYCYLFYQYQKRNIVYFMAAKINSAGKTEGDPIELDTTAINFFASNRIYNIVNSDDKQKIMIFKINTRPNSVKSINLHLYDAKLNLLKESFHTLQVQEKNDFLSEFTVDNDGDFAFIKGSGSSDNENITTVSLVTKLQSADSLGYFKLELPKIFLDDPKIRADNVQKQYLVTSFYSKTKRGNIDGLYCVLWSKLSNTVRYTTNTTFSDEIRNAVKTEGSTKAAFNNFFMQNIVFRKDGGFVIASEAAYSSNRGSNYNRWDYMNRYPFYSPYDFYYANPYYGSYYYPWWRYGGSGYQINRYFAENIAVLSFDTTATLAWTNVILKSQYDDYTDNFIGYGVFRESGLVHFLFNQLEKRTLLLTDQSINADGQINRTPTLRNLSKDYQFMPRYSKQVSAREIIIPCQYRNFTCFAKIEF